MQVLHEQTSHPFDSDKTREVLTEAFFNLVSHWKLSLQEQARLLGWNYAEKRSKIDAMRSGKSILDNDADKINRVVNLMNIHKCLRILFPKNRDLVYQWVKIPRDRFGGFSALDIMMQDGAIGIAAIRQYLEHERTR